MAERLIDSPSLKDIVFETSLSAASHRFLNDHRVFGRIIFPATGYLESVRAAAHLGLGGGNWAVENMVIGEALALDDTETKRLQVVLSRTGDGAAGFQVFSAGTARGRRIFVAAACLRLIAQHHRFGRPDPVDFETLKRGADRSWSRNFLCGL